MSYVRTTTSPVAQPDVLACQKTTASDPLDEANIDRFTALLNELSEETQFVLITHSKRTMETAQALYGVTQEEPGVSKIVSVRFD